MKTGSRRVDTTFIILLGAVVVFGLVILASASTVIAFQQHGESTYYLKRQLFNVLMGIIVFSVLMRIDYRLWRSFAKPALLISFVLLLLVFLPGLGRELQGARRWIDVGITLIQPAELVKLLLLIFLAAWLSERGPRLRQWSTGLWPFLLLVGSMLLLIALQPDVGTMAVVGLISLSAYFVAGAPLKDLVVVGFLSIGALLILLQSASYRTARFLVFLNPEFDPQGVGYQIHQSLLAIGSGGIFGLGLGHSRQKFNYLPEVATDSIFAVAAEELGFIMAIALLSLFLALVIRGFRIAQSASDEFGKILAAGITSWFAWQAFINVGALTGLLPLTGIPLPFISYGGTSLLVNFAAAGILANISRSGR